VGVDDGVGPTSHGRPECRSRGPAGSPRVTGRDGGRVCVIGTHGERGGRSIEASPTGFAPVNQTRSGAVRA
jgi:hypothetical protein